MIKGIHRPLAKSWRQRVMYVHYCPFSRHTCCGMPWNHLRQNLPRHLPPHTIEPSTDLLGIPSKPGPKPKPHPHPNPNPNPTLGAVNIGARGGCHDIPWGYHGVPYRLRGGCHVTTRGMPRHPSRRAINCFASQWDIVGMHNHDHAT